MSDEVQLTKHNMRDVIVDVDFLRDAEPGMVIIPYRTLVKEYMHDAAFDAARALFDMYRRYIGFYYVFLGFDEHLAYWFKHQITSSVQQHGFLDVVCNKVDVTHIDSKFVGTLLTLF